MLELEKVNFKKIATWQNMDGNPVQNNGIPDARDPLNTTRETH